MCLAWLWGVVASLGVGSLTSCRHGSKTHVACVNLLLINRKVRRVELCVIPKPVSQLIQLYSSSKVKKKNACEAKKLKETTRPTRSGQTLGASTSHGLQCAFSHVLLKSRTINATRPPRVWPPAA